MEIQVSLVQLVRLRLWELLNTKCKSGYPYAYLTPCAVKILLVAASCISDHEKLFRTSFNIIALKPLQFFLAGNAALNAICGTNFSRQNYKTGLMELRNCGLISIQSQKIPTLNKTTKKIIYKDRIGTIIDFSRLVLENDFNKFDLDTHGQPMDDHTPNHAIEEKVTMPLPMGTAMNTVKTGDENEVGNHHSGEGVTNLVDTELKTSNNLLDYCPSHDSEEGVTMPLTMGTTINPKEIEDENEESNHHSGRGVTIPLTNLAEGELKISNSLPNHPSNHDSDEGVTISLPVESSIKSGESINQKEEVNHVSQSGVTIPLNNKCCCSKEDLFGLDNCVPKDEWDYPRCPICNGRLELNSQLRRWGHPDYRERKEHGECAEMFSYPSLNERWKKKKANSQKACQQKGHENKYFDICIKNLDQQASNNPNLGQILTVLPKIDDNMKSEND